MKSFSARYLINTICAYIEYLRPSYVKRIKRTVSGLTLRIWLNLSRSTCYVVRATRAHERLSAQVPPRERRGIPDTSWPSFLSLSLLLSCVSIFSPAAWQTALPRNPTAFSCPAIRHCCVTNRDKSPACVSDISSIPRRRQPARWLLTFPSRNAWSPFKSPRHVPVSGSVLRLCRISTSSYLHHIFIVILIIFNI